MTEFKKGDRVKVEFEGVVKDVGTSLLGVVVGGIYRSANQSDATLLERPVEPLAVGSLVRVIDLGSHYVVQGNGKVTYIPSSGEAPHPADGVTPRDLAEKVASHSDRYTLIHDGSKK